MRIKVSSSRLVRARDTARGDDSFLYSLSPLSLAGHPPGRVAAREKDRRSVDGGALGCRKCARAGERV